eukprot:TRINITY_DN24653_c0_g1_i2.p1 TRINITY_DN24653_c0_g1~~TRINITY_DN24653_c0_g1_i2.p1  ORF type:complete len:446 (-),score=63.15 TRINITY_DN24653_c0_g1_i2:41-1378(-)
MPILQDYRPLLWSEPRSCVKLPQAPGMEQAVSRTDWGNSEAFTSVLDRVACHLVITVTSVDVKSGCFQLRMQCQWAFRTYHQIGDAEMTLRGVPGIRMPGLNVHVQESRIWKDLAGTEAAATSNLILWRGTSIFLLEGYKKFNVKDFPFDRQVISLQRLDFVWRSNKDDDDFFNTMKVVWLTVVSKSMLVEWSTDPVALRLKEEGAGDNIHSLDTDDDSFLTHRERQSEKQPLRADDVAAPHCTKFRIDVMIQRQHGFYVRQIFFVTYMITLASICPLAMPPTEDHMGDRLSVYGGGLLTLVAFKYGVMEHLPCVPYNTFIDDFLLHQILTVTAATFESLFVFRYNQYEETVDWIENCLLLIIAVMWGIYLLYVTYSKPYRRKSWKEVKAESDEAQEAEHTTDFFKVLYNADNESNDDSPRLTRRMTIAAVMCCCRYMQIGRAHV